MNYELFKAINQNAEHHPLLDGLMVFVSKDALLIYAIVLLLMWFIGKERYKNTVVLATITGVLGLVINFILSHICNEPRPFVTHQVYLLIQHAKDSSFPSDHTTGAFSLAFAVLWLKHCKIGFGMLLFEILTGISRVYVGHHYPFDVLASVMVALIMSRFVYAFSSIFRPIAMILISTYNRIPLVPKEEQQSVSKLCTLEKHRLFCLN